ncbi:hypothetical protein [Acinetobacter pittii]|uniref:hypothetical protein n=1 Tax=Acinetobacter pittii TaxID=48296 RepID=UPI00300A8CB4
MKDLFELFIHLIGLVAGELQYTGIDEKNIRNSLIDDNEEAKRANTLNRNFTGEYSYLLETIYQYH